MNHTRAKEVLASAKEDLKNGRKASAKRKVASVKAARVTASIREGAAAEKALEEAGGMVGGEEGIYEVMGLIDLDYVEVSGGEGEDGRDYMEAIENALEFGMKHPGKVFKVTYEDKVFYFGDAEAKVVKAIQKASKELESESSDD